jgi:phosphoribosylglycinamide formyltransferase-1
MSINLAVFVSGRGSNLEAILKAAQGGSLSAKVKAVVSNEPDVGAINIARKFGIEPIVVPSLRLARQQHESKILEKLDGLLIDYLVLAGYMRILSPYLLNNFRDSRGFYRVTNIHPSLLPAFPGMTAYEDAYTYGIKVSGITVHFVDDQVDHGPILAQEPFRRLPDDSLDDFKARGLALEHKLYPSVLQEIATDNIVIHARGKR